MNPISNSKLQQIIKQTAILAFIIKNGGEVQNVGASPNNL
jgi:hypothetical protein